MTKEELALFAFEFAHSYPVAKAMEILTQAFGYSECSPRIKDACAEGSTFEQEWGVKSWGGECALTYIAMDLVASRWKASSAFENKHLKRTVINVGELEKALAEKDGGSWSYL